MGYAVTELVRGLHNYAPILQQQGCVATIGNFDGVHRGHQTLLSEVTKEAARRKIPSVVVTFEPQPAEFFAPEKSIARLTRWREKFHALAQCGIDKVLVLYFNKALAALSAEEFIKTVLSDGIGAKHIIVGDDFRFGKARQGDFHFLEAAGSRYHFTTASMQSVMLEGSRVSSTRIRKALADKDHGLAERLLGHPYFMEGRVVHGDKRGRSIGFPTANIHLHRRATPVQGIYVVRMHGLSTDALPGVANIGTRPTVGGTRALLEVHLFDFNQDIYGRQVRVEFCKKLRDEERYASLELLRIQIEQDALQARAYFEECRTP